MSVWMGSQAGGWPGSMRMNYPNKAPIVPQVKLQLDVHPPVLDTGQKQMPTKTFGGGLGKQIQGGSGGQLWKSFRTMYESLCSGTPLTWVNPDAVGQQHPPYQLYPQFQYQCNVQPDIMYEDSSGLWYPAPPAGSRIDYMDPLIIWQGSPCPLFNFLPELNGTQLPQKVEGKKVCRPLNPEAKEWIPKEYIKDCEASTSSPRKETSDADCFGTKLPFIPNGLQYPANEDGLSDFCEITDTEVYAVRIGESDSFNSVPKGRAPQVTKKKLGVEKEGFKEKTAAIPVPSVMKDVPPAEDPSSYGCRDVEIHVCDNVVKDNRPLSYASIVGGTAASPTPQTHVCDHSFEKNSARTESVEQPIPKIFLKDKKYPKEKAAPSVDKKNISPFKTATKNQKRCSRNFLRELKELSPIRIQDKESMGSEPSLGSPYPDHSSPPKIYSTRSPLLMDSPPKASHKGNPLCPFGSPLPTNKAQRSLSESSSGSSRVRTASESSVTSVESVDIEFVSEDEVDRKCTGLNGNVLAENSEPNCVASPKYSNSVLALILGCDDSESEESDDELEDSDSDWDDVCVDSADNIILDDTWEIFGLGLTISEAGKTQNSNVASELECTIRSPVKPICDTANEEDPTGVTLEEINKRWEEEIEKDVLGTSERKVNFGEVIVHPMIVWSYAYKTSRMGPWEMYGRDRMRFSHRIAALESVISPVLQADHREAFYQKQRGLACCLS